MDNLLDSYKVRKKVKKTVNKKEKKTDFVDNCLDEIENWGKI